MSDDRRRDEQARRLASEPEGAGAVGAEGDTLDETAGAWPAGEEPVGRPAGGASAEAGAAETPGAGEVSPAEALEAEAPAGRGGAPESAAAELEAVQRELDALHDRHLRLAAEFENYRRRIERERAELWTRAQAELVKRLLDVLDDLQRVAHYGPDTPAPALLEGVQLVEKKLRHALESAGLEPIEAQGEFFNPTVMDAVLTAPAEHPEEDEVVLDVLQKGYRFQGLLLRPAKVRVKKYEG